MEINKSMKRNNSYVESISDEFLPKNGKNDSSRTPHTSQPTTFHKRSMSKDSCPSYVPTSFSQIRPYSANTSFETDYYQLVLQKEKEFQEQQNLFSLIYSSSSPSTLPLLTPPSHPPPAIPTASEESSSSRYQSDRSPLNQNFHPSTLKHLRTLPTSISFDCSNLLSQNRSETEAALVDEKTSEVNDDENFLNISLTKALEVHSETMDTRIDEKKLVFSEFEKISNLSLSMDENDISQNFPSPSPPSSLNYNFRSKSMSPTRSPKSTLYKNDHLVFDEKPISNRHEHSLFFCSPSTHSNASIELMNTSEMQNQDDDSVEFEEACESDCLTSPSVKMQQSVKSANIFTFDEKAVKTGQSQCCDNIQSRQLPQIPASDLAADCDISEPEYSPECEISEPEYACADGENEYETIHHQRSISDHVLHNYEQNMNEKVRAIDLKKSKSDGSERKSMHKTVTNSDEIFETSPKQPNQLSPVFQHRKTKSSYILTSDSLPQVEGIQNNELAEKTSRAISSSTKLPVDGKGTQSRTPRKKLSEQEFSESIHLRNSSKSMSTIGESKQKCDKDKKNTNNIFGGILSLRNRKKLKDNRSLGNIYPGISTVSSNSSSYQGYPYKADVLTLPDGLLNVFLQNGIGKQNENNNEGGTSTPKGDHHFFDDSIPLPLLLKPKWEDLELWKNEPGSWSACHPDLQLTSSEKKRQNIIYELYMTEINHCRVIVFLQQAYQVGLRQYNQALRFITDEQLDRLIPDVLDSLLDFHLNLLRRLKQRREKDVIVETVSDIVAEEFENGQFTTKAINAYTLFCISRDESCQLYEELMEKNSKCKRFFDQYEKNPLYKQHSFKSCLLLIAQRLTKYNLLFDSILKYDPIPLKPQTQRALTAVSSFARRVDEELKKNDVQKKWNGLKKTLDKRSRGKILNRDFTYDDLVHQRMDDPRSVLAIGKVNYLTSSISQHSKDRVELTMVLFDDILVLFHVKNNSMYFYNSNLISSVIPLKSLLVREMQRTNECMLICNDKEKPDMYHLSFLSKTELRNWVSAINTARAAAPTNVRFAPGRKAEIVLQKQEEFNGDAEFSSKLQEWQDALQKIFDERKQKEELLRNFMIERMLFFDEVRAHFKKFPIKHITASTVSLPPAAGTTIERKETRDLERIKKLVNQKFHELREHRRSGLDSLVETAQKARDNDLESFFDDLHDLSIGASSSSSDSSSPEKVESSTTSNSEDEPSASFSFREKKPRRVRTYHGTVDSRSFGSIRRPKRHTTVPKFGENDNIGAGEDENVEEQINQNLRKLPLSMSTRARKAASSLILENVNLRIENSKLKSEIALQEMHISSLRSRKPANVETEEKNEALRQKQEEIQARERKLKQEEELFKEEVRRKTDEIEAREEKLKWREVEMESRTKFPKETFRAGSCVFQQNEHFHQPTAPPTTSPICDSKIANLAVKTVKKTRK